MCVSAVVQSQVEPPAGPFVLDMDAAAWQAVAARMLATQQPPPPSFWQAVYSMTATQNQGQASSSSAGYVFPGSGQSASDAAMSYAAMLQLSEQARLIGLAESQSQAPLNPPGDEDWRSMLRELVRTEMKEAAAKDAAKDKKEKHEACQEAKLEAHNQVEKQLDTDRRAYEQSRLEESKRSDRRAIQIARDAYRKEQQEKQDAVKRTDGDFMQPTPKARPGLRCVGGYRVEGGYIQVFSKFKANDPKDHACDSSGKEVLETPVVEKEKDVKEAPTSSKMPVEPPGLPPHLPGPPPPGINPPPPPVDIATSKTRFLGL